MDKKSCTNVRQKLTTVPALAPLLDPYVATVDGLRLWLDAQLTALLS